MGVWGWDSQESRFWTMTENRGRGDSRSLEADSTRQRQLQGKAPGVRAASYVLEQ
jgi:hypothetical protein